MVGTPSQVAVCILSCFLLSCTESLLLDADDRKQYSMYVWRDGFDHNVHGCGTTEFLKWDKKHSHCYTHTWNTAEKRQWLWATCNRKGREIGTIFLADIYNKLKPAMLSGDCHTADIELIRKILTEGHTHVPGLNIYGLFAVSDEDVSERYLIQYVVWYNDVCANTATGRFDGVSVNNEAFTSIKCSSDDIRTRYLDRLQIIQNEARKQIRGTLRTHYSVSWNWPVCHGTTSLIRWNGQDKPSTHHMIDIFDSIDVQVAYTTFPAISDRMKIAGYDYAVSLGKTIHAEVYTTKDDPCQITYFPEPCGSRDNSERGMFAHFDNFTSHGIGQAVPCIHAFREVYSSGGHPLWPAHH